MKWYSIHARANRTAEIFIYGDIGESWFEETVTAKKFVEEFNALDADHITVRINSFGGSVPDAMAIYNVIKRSKAETVTAVDGMAASCASLVAMAGKKNEIAANATLMIHAPWSRIAGNANAMRERADMLDMWAKAMASSYARPNGLTTEAAEALLLDGKDHWYSAEEARAAGLMDEVVNAIPIAASFEHSRFVPPATAGVFRGEATSFSKGDGMKINSPAAAGGSAAQETEDQKRERVAAEVAAQKKLEAEQAADAAARASLGLDVAGQQIDTEAVRAQALADEAQRRKTIRAIAEPFIGRPEVVAFMNKALDDPRTSIEACRAGILQLIGRAGQALGGGFMATVEDETDKFFAGVASGMMIRAGLVPNDSTNEFRAYSMMELCRASLQRKNISTKGMDKMEIIGAAFTHGTSDFTNLLADVANKSMLRGYDEAEETFQRWTSRGTLPDFKPGKRVDLNTFPSLNVVEPGAEYKFATVGDRGETIQLATYGKMFSITRQAIINDDLDAFTRIPNKMGRAAVRTVGNLVYAVLTTNPNMSDGVALFHANHNNLMTGAVLSTASIDLMATAMALQKDPTGNTLNISLAYIITPRTLKGLAMQIANSEFEVGATSTTKANTVPNWVRGAFEVIADPRLDAASASNWFGAASPGVNDTIEVSYLDGNDRPTLEQQGGWTIDGVQFKVRLDAGVKALDFRGLAKNPN